MKRYCYNEEHNLFRESFRTFLQREVVPHREVWSETGITPRELYLKAGAQGFLIPQAPESLGGLGIDDFRFQQIGAEELGRCGESGFIPFLHSSIIAPYILKHGSDFLNESYIPRAVSGEVILGVAMTEPDAGSDLAGMRSSAIDRGDHYLLNGNKTYISNGINGDVFVVAARTDAQLPHGISLFVVEAGWEGFERGANLKKLGFKSQDTAELFFDNVKVPKSHLLGEVNQGFKYLMGGLVEERLICGLWNVGVAEYAFELTRDFVCERKVFGKPLAQQQNTRFKLAQLRARIDMMQAFGDTLVEGYNRGERDSVAASEIKLLSSELLGDVVDEGVQLHGGAGYMMEYPIARLYADARITRIFAGTSEIMKLIIAKSVLDG
ncbi:acyl-CoA dehydrogenase family protein [Kineobactrum salinum]|uniref:Acyl-CoA dehydrogenase n=1 Tax=Kineobactrum salinum TaxID=2708301 RepID=A0A6C0TZU1_9GAMM|nr:acyl-CoA dehydrogenase family protein [Kineobactrum salinum]QIB65053.1 acyl-CoA dehydrogenase [Kineobactrum salinum]